MLEGYDFDAELVLVLLDGLLGIVRSVEVDTLGVFARTGVITTHNEVRSTVVLTDDGVPDGFARSTHTHSERKQTDNGHSIGISGKERLVDTDTGEVVNVSRLGEANHGVD